MKQRIRIFSGADYVQVSQEVNQYMKEKDKEGYIFIRQQLSTSDSRYETGEYTTQRVIQYTVMLTYYKGLNEEV